MNWLNKLERKFGKFAIPGLMKIIVMGMGLVFAVDTLIPRAGLWGYLFFSPELIMQGQVWRIFTFIFLPPNSSLFWILFSLYFYYFIGSNLENVWGSFKFNMYYLIGMLGSILAGFLTGGATNDFLNLSLFFAFAAMFPEMQVLLFFVIPLKIKYLAYFNAALYLISFVQGDMVSKAAIIASLINVFIFFGGTFIKTIKSNIKYSKQRKQWQNNNNNGNNIPW